MNKFFLITLLTVLFIASFISSRYLISRLSSTQNQIKKVSPIPSSKPISKAKISEKSIFVPYWSLEDGLEDISAYDSIIYFGITPDLKGINKREQGYSGIKRFAELTQGRTQLLTVRMINDDINSEVLKSPELQSNIISETMELLEQNSFVGVVLDLEFSGILNTDVTDQINQFVQLFYTSTRNNYRKFYLTIYGDNFYRRRPYDISFINKNSDGIFIMAYDYHKSRGEPGPNFPFESGPVSQRGEAKYQYDFKKMVSDFSEVVEKEKISVVFGMFGYDWLVDEKKRPIRQAEALSLNEINKKFIEKCEFKNCINKRDTLSKESEINYIVSADTPDEQQVYRIDYHIVWYEDEDSVKAKTEYLQEQGIGRVSYWAYGYF